MKISIAVYTWHTIFTFAVTKPWVKFLTFSSAAGLSAYVCQNERVLGERMVPACKASTSLKARGQ